MRSKETTAATHAGAPPLSRSEGGGWEGVLFSFPAESTRSPQSLGRDFELPLACGQREGAKRASPTRKGTFAPPHAFAGRVMQGRRRGV